MGYLVPPVRVTDNLQLKAGEYVVALKGAEIARYEMLQNCELAIHAGTSGAGAITAGGPDPAAALGGTATREPAFGIPAVWVPAERAEAARSQGYTVVDFVGVLGTHLTGLIRRHAFELLSRQDTKNIRGLCT